MTSLTLFDHPRDARKLARRSDPITSKIAARINHDAHRVEVFAALVKHDGLTYRELAQHTTLDPVETMRRLGDLRGRGIAFHGPKRICKVCGHLCLTWTARKGAV